jgi:hypothetical protein
MAAHVVVTKDLRSKFGVSLSIPQGMDGKKLHKFLDKNRVVLQSVSKVVISSGVPVSIDSGMSDVEPGDRRAPE